MVKYLTTINNGISVTYLCSSYAVESLLLSLLTELWQAFFPPPSFFKFSNDHELFWRFFCTFYHLGFIKTTRISLHSSFVFCIVWNVAHFSKRAYDDQFFEAFLTGKSCSSTTVNYKYYFWKCDRACLARTL